MWCEALESRRLMASVPAGFSEQTWTSSLASPTAMQFAPDGRLFVCEEAGKLRIIKNGNLLSKEFLSVNVSTAGERGLLGVALDPNFASNGFVYVYYTATTPAIHNRVSRFTANGDVAVAGSEQIIFELNDLPSATNHNGGGLHFGADGKLYIAVGDAATPSNAQTKSNLFGKMLRINKDGTIPTDNPFYNSTTGKNRSIWALGLRNPFSFDIQPGTGRIYLNDVGSSGADQTKVFEEVNEGAAGANYGWPGIEGPRTNQTPPAGYRDPVYAYPHEQNGVSIGCSIVGAAFYNPANATFPINYHGDYFFADFCGGFIKALDIATKSVTTLATSIDTPIALDVNPLTGELVYLTRSSAGSKAVAIRFNNAPVVAEAERFNAKQDRNGKSWTQTTSFSGFSGFAAMQALTDTGVVNNSTFVASSPRLDYSRTFSKSGTHYVWIRGRAPNSAGDSLHVGINGQAVATADRIEKFSSSSFTWSRATMDGAVATVNVPSAGAHTINVWMREDGFILDKVLLTSDPNFVPSGVGPADTGGGSSQLRIEAETASGQANFSPFVVATDATVGQYIHVPTTSQQQSSPPTKGIATYDMVIPETGTYALWARVNAPDFNNDSFFVSIDGSAWSTWDLPEGGGWKWVKFTNVGFSSGNHQLRIAMREDGTKLDAIYLSTDLTTTPV